MTVIAREVVQTEMLQSLVRRASAQASTSTHPVLVSFSTELPEQIDQLQVFSSRWEQFDYRSYWEQPSEGVFLVGLGEAVSVRSDSTARFQEIADEIGRILDSARIENTTSEIRVPVFLGGFRFDPERFADSVWPDSFAPGVLTLPQYMLSNQDGVTTVTVNLMVERDVDVNAQVETVIDELQHILRAQAPQASVPAARQARCIAELPSKDDWQQRVATATADIQAGSFKKIVLARQLNITHTDDIDPVPVLKHLREQNPTARIFAFAMPGGCFVGASPELLAKRTNGYVEVSCLAGSTPRSSTPELDEQYANEMLNDEKNLYEHAVVARQIHDVLDAVCDEVEQGELGLMLLPTVQHLHTPFKGHLLPDSTLLDVVSRLHPTPAVGAYPQCNAIHEIREREGIDRGWYAAPVGWIGADGRGEFAVALRSGLLAGNQAALFAGCGIVGDSDPGAEYDEAGLKLKPVLTALETTP